ncbi:PaaI family thioesterase [Anaeromyxobacter diazotrophicus]|uniref:Medium/long-chain acyl-CoA thioesterase YigI n=1 Tax=Anaeromyxobacter diazotrophicus TaxID=2590199 RepID=A0A7I9VS24_9BACT|nr:PaaI family thioesterase [Anaeromyxobacter diazotrophicus]GEJ59236.1 thioesterase superfamily protein [Anaeromyxobacter diazotrophicus]
MSAFQPADPRFDARVRASFARQAMMATLGATLERVAPGEVDLRLPFRADLTQQHGFLHAGAMTAVADSACGYAALTLMPADAAVLTVEFKVNLLAPGKGESFVARGRVLKAGRTLTTCAGDVFASAGSEERLVLTMLATMMAVRDRAGLAD